MPVAAELVDPDRGLGLLRRLLAGRAVTTARLRYLEYAPRRSALALFAATVDGGAERVMVSLGRPDPGAGLNVAIYPHDPALVGLGTAKGELLTWVPLQRAVLRDGNVIRKFHADPGSVAAAVAALEAVAPWVRAPQVIEVDHAACGYVQSLLPGATLGRADALAATGAAATLLQRLHRAPLGGLATFGPADLLALCGPVTELASFALPALGARIEAVTQRLADRAPLTGALVPSHGDFNVGQLVGAGAELAMVDVDTLCLASPALDLASYAANLAAGRPGDLDDIGRVLDRLAGAYGVRPADLDWYLAAIVLRRLDRGLRRYKSDWPARTERLLATVETLAP